MVTRPEFLNNVLKYYEAARYLEVGVSEGETFFAIDASRKVAVDPQFRFNAAEAAQKYTNSEFHEITSDAYFSDVIKASDVFDVIYLDGLHTFEQTLRDFTNAIRFLADDGVIVIDDVVPTSYQAALPSQQDSFIVKRYLKDPDNSWMGDTYKLVFFIEAFFPTYQLRTIADNHGQAVIWKVGPSRKAFRDYSIHEIARLEFIDVIKQSEVFYLKSGAEIVDEIGRMRGSASARSRAPDGSDDNDRRGPASSAQSTVPLSSVARERMVIAPGETVDLPATLVYGNVREFNPEFADHLVRDIYAPRRADVSAIELVSLPEAQVHVEAEFSVTVGDVLIEEQLPPWGASNLNASEEVQVPEETLIVARFGYVTWGHWVGEMLPKMVMVERAHPGQYRYAVPAEYMDPRYRTYLSSIQAYGIGMDRLVLLEPGTRYVLERPWATTPIWSNHVMHPRAVDAMRDQLPASPGGGPKRIALVRRAQDERELENWDELFPLLSAQGFEAVDATAMSFIEQANLFRGANAVVSVLGSGLAGLVFSPRGVKVLSMAPALFGDRFFSALIASRQGQYADLRGEVTRRNERIPHRSSFRVDPKRLAEGLSALSLG